MKKIKVLVIDDSAVMREFLTDALSKSPKIEVVGTAIDPYIAVNKINKFQPDVITLDIILPRMDGLTFLSKLMTSRPMPVIMVSSLTSKGARETFDALEIGAIDFICKPSSESSDEIDEFSLTLVQKVIGASKAKIRKKSTLKIIEIREKHSVDAVIPKKNPNKFQTGCKKVIAIGASTGGANLIEDILTSLPEDVPSIIISQHMPEQYTYEYAKRINRLTSIYVKEAEHGEKLYMGRALIAPGGKHMLLRRDGKGFQIEINDGPPVNRFKPSVEVLFRSVSQSAGSSATGIICSGMGKDGAKGLLEMKNSGAFTIAQDEESSVVYGMPREAVRIGAAKAQYNVKGIIDYILQITDGTAAI